MNLDPKLEAAMSRIVRKFVLETWEMIFRLKVVRACSLVRIVCLAGLGTFLCGGAALAGNDHPFIKGNLGVKSIVCAPKALSLQVAERPDTLPVPLNLDEVKKTIVSQMGNTCIPFEGKVLVKIWVDIKGNPIRHTVLLKAAPRLTSNIEEAIYTLEFDPAIQSGKPVETWVLIPFKFTLIDK